ncbi:hypothetical protein DRW03_36375 [Corallococcus sp. H22C18031201]|nr:hypothetical protein DRW03_36375 [Corallococcus sp. H22C18031201]
MMGVLQTSGRVTVVDGKEPCPLCEGQHGALEETQETKVDASALAAKLEAMVNARKGRRLVTMLGVVQCKCGKKRKYADQSGVTLLEFSEAVADLEWVAPDGALSIDVRDVGDEVYTATRARLLAFLRARCGESPVKSIWDLADARAEKSDRNRSGPAAYPPGTCAAQKALMLALVDGAYPGGLTERWFHSARKPTAAPIRFFDESLGKVAVRPFDEGKTVPPCQSCELIVPLMLCPGDKEEKCQHKI